MCRGGIRETELFNNGAQSTSTKVVKCSSERELIFIRVWRHYMLRSERNFTFRTVPSIEVSNGNCDDTPSIGELFHSLFSARMVTLA